MPGVVGGGRNPGISLLPGSIDPFGTWGRFPSPVRHFGPSSSVVRPDGRDEGSGEPRERKDRSRVGGREEVHLWV